MQRFALHQKLNFFLLLYFSLFISLNCLFPAFAELTRAGLTDDQLLDEVQKSSLQYFLREQNENTGLVYDSAANFKRGGLPAPSSIAATGFGLAAYPVGVTRGWLDAGTAREKTRRTLRLFLSGIEHEHGFFYHFLNPATGKPSRQSELSPIDTSLFLAGAIFAAQYFEDPEITGLAQKIYERVDWQWMLNGGKTLALAWDREKGFSHRRWDRYDESMIMYLLAIGSPTHPIPAESWHAISRPVGSYKQHRLIQMPPLFTHQYSHIWIDFRNQHDAYADYFTNSVQATLVNRQFAIDHAAKYQSYGENSWGLTASDGPFGYKAYGAPPGWSTHDGTVAPTACGGSIVFTPEYSKACLRYFYEQLGDRLWGRYGFSDAFNLDRDWVSDKVIAIDQGAMLLMIENHRSGLIWKEMKDFLPVQNAMKAVGFQPGAQELAWPDPPEYQSAYLPSGIQPDGYLKDWPNLPAIVLTPDQHLESGHITDAADMSGTAAFAWNETALYFYIKVKDQDMILNRAGQNIWQNDCLEIYIDPQGDGLLWNSMQDYQIGFSNEKGSDEVRTWSWFQGGEDPQKTAQVLARGYIQSGEFLIEGAIRWSYLGLRPEQGMTLRLSPAFHDMDRDRTEGKLQWFFRPEDTEHHFQLGRIRLSGPHAPAPNLPVSESSQPQNQTTGLT